MILYWNDEGKDVQKLPYPMTPRPSRTICLGLVREYAPGLPGTVYGRKHGQSMGVVRP